MTHTICIIIHPSIIINYKLYSSVEPNAVGVEEGEAAVGATLATLFPADVRRNPNQNKLCPLYSHLTLHC